MGIKYSLTGITVNISRQTILKKYLELKIFLCKGENCSTGPNKRKGQGRNTGKIGSNYRVQTCYFGVTSSHEELDYR